MSLGSLGNNLNSKGDPSQLARARILKEAEDHKKRLEEQEADRARQDISHRKLQKQTLEGHINTLRNEILRANRGGSSDHTFRMEVANKERRLRQLENEKLHLEGEIRSLEGKTHGAHNVHYNNPHYF